ncbi:MAG: cytochrome c [Puniceicoccaceae bacterium]|nr:MAG: cytochrome c [Puniceicoccaceae bacterium]
MRYVYLIFGLSVITVLVLAGFRGSFSERPPIEIFPDMERQPKVHPQSPSTFFSDGRSDRPPPAGTVPRGAFYEDTYFASGKQGEDWGRGIPVEVTQQLMARGRERYNIYCTVCHGTLGDGAGITREYGMIATPTFHDARLRDMPDGEIYEVITNGRNLMGHYRYQISKEDRWAIVAYVRALQRSRQGTVDDVPPANLSELGL